MSARRPKYVDLTQITRRDYERVWQRENATALPDFPTVAVFERFTCGVSDFLTEFVFPAWFTAVDRQRFIPAIEDPAQVPISFPELLRHPRLVSVKLGEFVRKDAPPHVIVEKCRSCGVSVVKDGNKRLLAIAVSGEPVALQVTQVAGANWCNARYDMRKICRCARTA